MEPDTKPIISRKDVAASLYGLAGRYPTRELYARYVAAVTEAGREPATIIAYGKVVAGFGFVPWHTKAGRGFILHTKWIFATN